MTRTDDIIIPEFEIADGWYVSDLETVQDCRDAMDVLDVSMAGIKDQLARYDAGLYIDRDADWRIRAETALRYRRMAHHRAHVKLSELTGVRDLNVTVDRLQQTLARVRKVLVTASDETLRSEIEALVERKAA